MNNDIKIVIETIFNTSIDEENRKIEEELGNIFDEIVNSNADLKNMERFDILIRYELDNALRFLIGRLNPEVSDKLKLLELYFLYNNYSYML